MGPKRSGGASSTSNVPKKTARQSKLAKENDISAEEEAEIKEAFNLFCVEPSVDDDDEAPRSRGESVIRTRDIRRALIALGLPPKDQSELASLRAAVDPDSTGYADYRSFISLCALKLHARSQDSVLEEIEHAFRLFTRGTDGPIQLSHLRRVARELKEDVSDELLRDMILEANEGEGLHTGVNMEQFREVMIRAGVVRNRGR